MSICPSRPLAQVNLEAVSNVEVFSLRCEVRAFLVAEGEIDLHKAVDGLQASGVRLGLLEEIGQDAVQAIMAKTFAEARAVLPEVDFAEHAWAAPGWREAAVAYHKERGTRVAVVEISPPGPSRPRVAASIIQAAEYLIKEGEYEPLRAYVARHSAKERNAIFEHFEQKAKHADPKRS
jgi:hypothetical protein